MNRRRALGLMAALFVAAPGCNSNLWGDWGKKKVEPYEAVENGMDEKQVLKILGEPTRRAGIDLEGTGTRATNLTWVGHSQLIIVTFVAGKVLAKRKF